MVAMEKVPFSANYGRGDNLSAEWRPHVPFALGLVVGKFAPLHLGHEWLIEQAAQQCDRLLILSYSNPEYVRCCPTVRRRWFAARFSGHEAIVVDDQWLRQRCAALGIPPRPLPKNNSRDEAQQTFLAWLLAFVLQRRPDAIFCSESYGTECAKVLTHVLGHTVTPIIFDLTRSHVPVSASQIRRNPQLQRQWLAPEVNASFVYRIALLGGESTGKTSLAAALAAHFGTAWIHEYGRELWEQQSGDLSEADLLKIAREHIRREEAEAQVANRYLFCDTSPLTTAGYAGWMFGRVESELANLAMRSYHAIVLCRPDFPFVQDGTRRDEAFRLQQHAWYEERLGDIKTPLFEAAGGISHRVLSVARWIGTLSVA
jgi:NadR type nicotinamide-nucleotide adenylyltransferase